MAAPDFFDERISALELAAYVRRAAHALEARLSDPVDPRELSDLLAVSVNTVYARCRLFVAAQRRGDKGGMRGGIPCIQTSEHRYIIPRAALVVWYLSAGTEVFPSAWRPDPLLEEAAS